MASIFKRKYQGRAGQPAECKNYTVAFTDGSDPSRGVGVVRQVPGFQHKGASEDLLRERAERIAAKAEGGEILVADTVRGLCSGKGFLFADHGDFVAKGFEEPVRLFDVSWRGQD